LPKRAALLSEGDAMEVERKLAERGLVLPPKLQSPAGVIVPFVWVRVHGDRAYVSGHGPQHADGSPAGPYGKVGAEVSAEEAYQAARLATLAMLGSLGRTAIGVAELATCDDA
jgi:hypothetical protein